MTTELTRVVEALLFAADEPLSVRAIAEVVEAVAGEAPRAEEVAAAVEALEAEYAESRRAFRVRRWAGGYRLATEPSLAPFVRQLHAAREERRLSRSVMETLAIIAYRQPVTRPEIDFIRGVDAGYAVRRLLEDGFVEVCGRNEGVGRPLLYGTTAFFLEQFGMEGLADLPRPREIEELLNDPSFNRERATLLMLEGLETPHGTSPPTEEI